LENDLIRVWISQSTANILEKQIGSLDPSTIAAAIERAHTLHEPKDGEPPVFGNPAISVCIPFEAYELINTTFDGISDEHNFKQLVELLS